jgi:glycosyl transferase family 25
VNKTTAGPEQTHRGCAHRQVRAFVINLDSAGDRWATAERNFTATGLDFIRVPAIDGTRLELPVSGYSEPLFRRRHGRTTNLREVGCYLSHVRALEMFLESEAEYGLICEDDVTFHGDFSAVLESLCRSCTHWDIARLSGLGKGSAIRAIPLRGPHYLCINLGRLKGAGAYVVSRRAAYALVRSLLPMKVPFDHAVDREWFCGLRAVSVQPFPISQTESGFRTSIQRGPARRLGGWRRMISTYPYQAVNEMARWLFRLLEILRIFLWRGLCRPPADSAPPEVTPEESVPVFGSSL